MKEVRSAISEIWSARFGRSTRLPPPHDAVRNRVSPSMPGMSARHLVAPEVAYKRVLQPVLCRFDPFPTKNGSPESSLFTLY